MEGRFPPRQTDPVDPSVPFTQTLQDLFQGEIRVLFRDED
jgi:hypothetical protein